ncbi:MULTISPECIES: hypothetical protein [Pseudomonas]|uniref:hypothetical protein n=1 Tax=Pseudomonas TaxID=286 RepID=UPI000217361C|nr:MULTISPECIES: hypothetical protein [Pseudomonas]AEJ13045.1 hypothetical protein PPS_2486 [Pseudomonas putida S16]WOB61335.1 hypothetical protein NY023_13060 [Pseudomonas sp. NBB]
MVGAPAPIAPSAVTEYLDRYPSVICREEFDTAICALDDEFRRRWDEQQEQERQKSAKR